MSDVFGSLPGVNDIMATHANHAGPQSEGAFRADSALRIGAAFTLSNSKPGVAEALANIVHGPEKEAGRGMSLT